MVQPPHQRFGTESGWRIGGQCFDRNAKSHQAGSSAGEPCVMAEDDADVVRHLSDGGGVCAGVFGDDYPALGCGVGKYMLIFGTPQPC